MKTKEDARFKHGFSRSKEYQSWNQARQRVFNKTNHKYPDYGGRGISMSDAWANDFMTFYREIGPRPPGMSLDRIDNDGPYSRENCRWATVKEQGRNRRSTFAYRIGDESMSLAEWSEISGVPLKRIWKRIKTYGWSIERAVFETRKLPGGPARSLSPTQVRT